MMIILTTKIMPCRNSSNNDSSISIITLIIIINVFIFKSTIILSLTLSPNSEAPFRDLLLTPQDKETPPSIADLHFYLPTLDYRSSGHPRHGRAPGGDGARRHFPGATVYATVLPGRRGNHRPFSGGWRDESQTRGSEPKQTSMLRSILV